MKKRKNIFISAITCMFSICLMMIGVYAASSPNVSVSGQVSYTARDASVLVQGKADETGAGISANDFSDAPATKDFTSLTKVTSGKSYLDWTNGENSDYGADNFSNWTDLNLSFVEDSNGVNDITIGFYMTNYSNYPVKATITVQKDIANVTITGKSQVVLFDAFKQNPTSKFAKITLSLVDDSVNVSAQELGINVVFEKYVSEPVTSKLDFAYTTDSSATMTGGYYTASIKSDAEGEIVYPATYNDGTHGELPVAPNGLNVVGNSLGSFDFLGIESGSAYKLKNEKITSVVVSEGITELQTGAFAVLTKLENVVLPSTLKYIGAAAFACCDSLTQISLPDGLEVIDAKKNSSYYIGAFVGSKNLSSIIIPKSVKSIGEDAFAKCKKLDTLTFAQGSQCTKIGYEAFYDSGLKSIVLPDSITSIGNDTFFGCTSLTSVTIPEGMKSIGYRAFSGCTGLTSIAIPESVTSIRWSAFSGCTSLTSVTIPESVTIIESGTFSGCTSLISVAIPEVVTSIEYRAFKQCSALKSVTIPNGVKSIENETFSGCTALTSITIPESVTSIGNSAFADTGLTSITIPESVTSIGSGAFSDCTALISVTMPDSYFDDEGCEYIGGVFSGCTALGNEENAYYIGPQSNPYLVLIGAKSSKIRECEVNPNTKCISDGAFLHCEYLTSVTIPEGVTTICGSAFACCSNLSYISIPDSVVSIGYDAFGECENLLNGYCQYGDEDHNDWGIYIGNPSNPYLIFLKILEPSTDLTEYEINSNTRFIYQQAFYDCTGLTSVTIPEGVTSIDDETFSGCTGLTSITIPNSVTSISDSAFSGCDALMNENNLYDNAYYIGNQSNPYLVLLWAKSTEITECQINANTKFIYSHAFSGCADLTSIVIPESVTSIGFGAFVDLENLTMVTVYATTPPTIEQDEYIFELCYKLTAIYVPAESVDAYEASPWHSGNLIQPMG